jgi:fatty-acyl-CoA synthase
MEAATSGNSHYVLRALELLAGYGDREALVGRDRRFTYTQLCTAIMDMAGTMRFHGIRRAMTVVVLVDRPVEAPIVQLALHALGARTVWIDPDAARRDLGEYLRLVRPDVLLYDARTQGQRGRELGGLLGVPVLRLGTGGPEPDLPAPDLLEPNLLEPNLLGPDLLGPDLLEPAGAPLEPAEITGTPDSIFQTSGTTGVPKLVHHRETFYRQVIALAEELVASGEHRLRHLSVSALSYLSGQISTLLYLFAGGTLILLDGFEPADFLATIERERVNSTFVPPPLLYALLDSPALDAADVSGLEMLSVGAAPATTWRLRQAIDRFGPVVRITYGLSECPFISAFPEIGADPTRPDLLRSCGRPYGDVRVQIRAEDGTVLADSGSGSTSGRSAVGELWVSSGLNFAGYWGQPELTGQTLVDGWVRTRDLGYRDADGRLYLVGRTSDVIITGQYCDKVYPRVVEDTLTSHPQVRAAAVIGVPSSRFGAAVHAYVVRYPGATVTDAELAALVRAELAESWVPESIDFVDSLPVTATGKVNTAALRDRYAAARTVEACG